MTGLRYGYCVVTLFLWWSTAATCYAPPSNQHAAEAFLPLLVMWSWLSMIAAAGITVVVLRSTAKRAVLALLLTISFGAASVAFYYWTLGRILQRDITTLTGAAEITSNIVYVLTAISCFVAPGAFAVSLRGLRRTPA